MKKSNYSLTLSSAAAKDIVNISLWYDRQVDGHAVHIPYHTTWAHEVVEESVQHPNFRHFDTLKEILPELI